MRQGSYGSAASGQARTIHPAEALSRDHLEVDALVAVLGVDKMRQFDSVELLRDNSVEVDKRSRHPIDVLDIL